MNLEALPADVVERLRYMAAQAMSTSTLDTLDIRMLLFAQLNAVANVLEVQGRQLRTVSAIMDGSAVKMPMSEAEAVAMVNVGIAWLKEHAPVALLPQLPPAASDPPPHMH